LINNAGVADAIEEETIEEDKTAGRKTIVREVINSAEKDRKVTGLRAKEIKVEIRAIDHQARGSKTEISPDKNPTRETKTIRAHQKKTAINVQNRTTHRLSRERTQIRSKTSRRTDHRGMTADLVRQEIPPAKEGVKKDQKKTQLRRNHEAMVCDHIFTRAHGTGIVRLNSGFRRKSSDRKCIVESFCSGPF
jgi:hypothetical protein